MPKYRLKVGKYSRVEETGKMIAMHDRDGKEYKIPETQFVIYDARDPQRNTVELEKEVAEHPDNALRFELVSRDKSESEQGLQGAQVPGQFDPQAELRIAEDQTTTATTANTASTSDSSSVSDLGWQEAVTQIQSMESADEVEAAIEAERSRSRPRASVLDAGQARLKELEK